MFGWLFPKQSKEEKLLNELITNVTSESLAKSSASGAGSVSQKQKATYYAGSGSTIKNVDLIQSANLNLTVLSKTSVLNKFNADLVDELTNSITEQKSLFPSFNKTSSKSETRNIVEKNVHNTFTTEALASISASIDTEQKVDFIAEKKGKIKNVTVSQQTTMIAKLVNDMSNNITNELKGDTNIANENVRKSPLGVLGDSVTNLLGGDDGEVNWLYLIYLFIFILIIYLVISIICYKKCTDCHRVFTLVEWLCGKWPVLLKVVGEGATGSCFSKSSMTSTETQPDNGTGVSGDDASNSNSPADAQLVGGWGQVPVL